MDNAGPLVDFSKPLGYLRWDDLFVGVINHDYTVIFTHPTLNKVVEIYTKGAREWSKEEFKNFLDDRIVSKERNDIGQILSRLSLTRYNHFDIAFKTRAFNRKDRFWISFNKNEKMSEHIKSSLENFLTNEDAKYGDSINSPGGVNEKYYGVFSGIFGLYKKRLNPMSSDVESEIAVYMLAKLMGVNCCPAFPVTISLKRNADAIMSNAVFSEFVYDWNSEYIVHGRGFFTEEDRDKYDGNEYKMFSDKFYTMKRDFAKMILLDFVTRQTDRHSSNYALKVTSEGVMTFYPLYDNGRSLFYEDREEFIKEAVKDIEGYSESFGRVGTYFDAVHDVAKTYTLSSLVNLNISREEIFEIYKLSGLTDCRLEGAVEWTVNALAYLQKLNS